MKSTVADICRVMEQIAPVKLAEEWDNVGLMLGNPAWPVQRIMLALDLTPDVVEQACVQKADMVITHHPFFFSPMKTLACTDEKSSMAYKMIEKQIAVYSAHTNLDIARGGVNDVLAGILGLCQIQILKKMPEDAYYKLVVFVPKTHTEEVLSAMAAAGAGKIGNYSECAYVMEGEGRFRPLEGSAPFIGKKDVLEKTKEDRVEVLVASECLQKTIAALKSSHPYEEPAYDLLITKKESGNLGLGRVGFLEKSLSLTAFGKKIKTALAIDNVTIVDAGKVVYKVAVCGGSGTDLIKEAAAAGADTLVTGDVKYHVAQEAIREGLNLIDAGHQTTELPVLSHLEQILGAWAEESNRDVTFFLAEEKRLLQYL